MNVMAAYTFDLQFCYVLPGWEGLATDSTVLKDAFTRSFRIPEGRFYLADAGYPLMKGLLIPFRGVRYHLNEWGRSKQR